MNKVNASNIKFANKVNNALTSNPYSKINGGNQHTVTNTQSSHPIIQNTNQYVTEKKYISINSEDRDILLYPKSSEFEIELPQDYNNVRGVNLSSWVFPSNLYPFSLKQGNTMIIFQFTKVYAPIFITPQSSLLYLVWEALSQNINYQYVVFIDDGFYTPQQLATELTNKFNTAVNNQIIEYFNRTDVIQNLELLQQYFPNAPQNLLAFLQKNINDFLLGSSNYQYTEFVVAFNQVSSKMWFGNKSSQFILLNDLTYYTGDEVKNYQCNKGLPQYANWGLPYYLGFTHCKVDSIPTENSALINLPRFYYGDYQPGDNGYWLQPNPIYTVTDLQEIIDILYNNLPAFAVSNVLLGAPVYYLEANFPINILGNAHIYLEMNCAGIADFNNIDETSPFTVNSYTASTNQTTGIVKSCFAKIPVISTPLSQFYDANSVTMKTFNPPAERIRKISIKIRYHNGTLVDFQNSNYSIVLEMIMLQPQNWNKYITHAPEA